MRVTVGEMRNTHTRLQTGCFRAWSCLIAAAMCLGWLVFLPTALASSDACICVQPGTRAHASPRAVRKSQRELRRWQKRAKQEGLNPAQHDDLAGILALYTQARCPDNCQLHPDIESEFKDWLEARREQAQDILQKKWEHKQAAFADQTAPSAAKVLEALDHHQGALTEPLVLKVGPKRDFFPSQRFTSAATPDTRRKLESICEAQARLWDCQLHFRSNGFAIRQVSLYWGRQQLDAKNQTSANGQGRHARYQAKMNLGLKLGAFTFHDGRTPYVYQDRPPIHPPPHIATRSSQIDFDWRQAHQPQSEAILQDYTKVVHAEQERLKREEAARILAIKRARARAAASAKALAIRWSPPPQITQELAAIEARGIEALKQPRLTERLMAKPSALKNKKRVLIALDGSGSMFAAAPGSSSNNQLPDNDITSLAVHGNALWVGTEGGLARLDLTANTVTHTFTRKAGLPDNEITSLALHDNALWMGTLGGLARLDLTANTVTHTFTTKDGLPHNNIRSLTIHDNDLWVEGFRGLARLDLTSNTFTHTFTRKDSWASSWIHPSTGQGNNLWVGTTGGLEQFDLTAHTVTHTFTRKDGLPDNDIMGLAVHGNALWVGTTSGLARLDLTANTVTHTFTGEDGLPAYGVTSLAAHGDALWVGTWGGLARLDADTGQVQQTWSLPTYFDLACDALLNTLDAMDADTEVSLVLTDDSSAHSVLLAPWTSKDQAAHIVAGLKATGSHKAKSLIQNPGGGEGFAATLNWSKTLAQQPDLLIWMHDGKPDNLNADIQASHAPRSFTIQFQPFGSYNKDYFKKATGAPTAKDDVLEKF